SDAYHKMSASGETIPQNVELETKSAKPTTPEALIDSPSVNSNGDWPAPVLALRESAMKFAQDWKFPGSSENTRSPTTTTTRKRRDPVTVERANLLNITKLIIKELIDSSLSQGRMLDDDHVPLQQFFVVMEHVFRHGLKPKKGILRDKHEFWYVLERLEKICPDAQEITTSVKEMPHIKTPLGRARAWLRLALMQKTLADYFRVLVDRKDEILREYYDENALMMEEEATVIGGMLVGLNVIDCTFCIKEEDLDQPIGVIDFSLYLNYNDRAPDDVPENDAKMAAILDQKNYLEELNRHLNATVTNLQQKLESTQTTNALMKEDLAIAKNNILTLQEENSTLRTEKEDIEERFKKHVEANREDIDTERQTYQTNRQGLDNLYEDTKNRLAEETQMRLDTEKELELQIGMKQEMEVAVRLLEKDIHEKQDTVITLRKQLEEIKAMNLEMYNKMQSCETSLKHKIELVVKLEKKTTEMTDVLKKTELKLKQSESDKFAAEETARKLGQYLAEKDAKKSALETDLKIEREWRGTLQKNLEQEKEKVAQTHNEIQKMVEVQKNYKELQQQHQRLQQTCHDQESALSELGSHLSESKLKVEDLREAQQAVKEAAWTDDKEVNSCMQCTKQFSVSRRKHHCRNCGQVFCNECSDNKMPLPSSAKPVRVCDACHTSLLERYSAKN
ncbi:unnamed protein product, partial [Owenia fusiformis]